MVQNALIQMRTCPAQRNIELEQLCHLISSLPGIGIASGLKWCGRSAALIQRNTAVHHGADAQGTELSDDNAVLLFHVLLQCGIARLQAMFNFFIAAGPYAVLQLIFPVICTDAENITIRG